MLGVSKHVTGFADQRDFVILEIVDKTKRKASIYTR